MTVHTEHIKLFESLHSFLRGVKENVQEKKEAKKKGLLRPEK